MARAPWCWGAKGTLLVLMLTTLATCFGSPRGSSPSIDNPVALLKTLSKMSPQQQDLLLTMMGTALAKRHHLPCNPFAGDAKSCRTLPHDASYLRECPAADTRTDCLLGGLVGKNTYNNPADDLQAFLAEHQLPAKALCPQCFDAMGAMWCALAAPKCGTFHLYMQRSVLPSMAKISAAFDRGDTKLEALGDALSMFLEATKSTMPCREMCQAVTETCGCLARSGLNSSDSFGSLLAWMKRQKFGPAAAVPTALSRLLFVPKALERPLCDLFMPSTDPGFQGTCAVPPGACSSPQAWCQQAQAADGGGLQPFKYVQGLLAMQMMKATVGWITDNGLGLWSAEDLAVEPDVPEVPEAEKGAGRQGGGQGGGAPVVAALLLSVVAVAALLAGAVAARRLWQQRQRTQGGKYTELGELEPGLGGRPGSSDSAALPSSFGGAHR